MSKSPDKRAANLKKKRRQERQAEKDKEAEKLFRKFKEYQKERGVKVRAKKEKVYRMANQIEREVIAEAIIDSVIAVMYCLNIYCGFGQNRLFKYSRRVQRIITAVGQETRPLKKLESELTSETGLDVRQLFKNDAKGKRLHGEKENRAALIKEYIPNGIIICLYVLYFDYGWKKKRMARIAEQVKNELDTHIENMTMENMKEHLQKRGISVSKDGNVENVLRK